MCNTCPFNYFSEESDRVQNYGCLPTPLQIVEMCKEENKNWACHGTNELCGGYIAYLKRNKQQININLQLILLEGVHL